MINYTDIQGWFSEEEFYSRMVKQAVDGAVFVEVGCWLGKSTCFLAQAIKESGKRIKLYAVDTWQGSPNEPNLMAYVSEHGGSVADLFLGNMALADVAHVVQAMPGDSTTVAKSFSEGVADFIFIDADHRYEAVKADILAWLPKVKVGGTLAGHDWNVYEGVQRAVRECLANDFVVEGNCWVHSKK